MGLPVRPTSGVTYYAYLPNEILDIVFSHLGDVTSIARVERVCKNWQANTGTAWEALSKRDWANEARDPSISAKVFYQIHLEKIVIRNNKSRQIMHDAHTRVISDRARKAAAERYQRTCVKVLLSVCVCFISALLAAGGYTAYHRLSDPE